MRFLVPGALSTPRTSIQAHPLANHNLECWVARGISEDKSLNKPIYQPCHLPWAFRHPVNVNLGLRAC